MLCHSIYFKLRLFDISRENQIIHKSITKIRKSSIDKSWFCQVILLAAAYSDDHTNQVYYSINAV